MREDITSIPVNEVFEPREGCPICRMRGMLEQRVVDYITGAAMMEPDVRIETNRLGFCFAHFEMMLKKRNRLGIALMLQSHLDEIDKKVFGKKLLPGSKKCDGQMTCFVCKQVDWAMERMLSTVCRLWERERDFRALYEQQAALCLPHYYMLCQKAAGEMGKKTAKDFIDASSALSKRYLDVLRDDVGRFCRMFDYRSGGENGDWGNSKDSIERSIWWLTSRHPD